LPQVGGAEASVCVGVVDLQGNCPKFDILFAKKALRNLSHTMYPAGFQFLGA
jgi:hypothetical protein